MKKEVSPGLLIGVIGLVVVLVVVAAFRMFGSNDGSTARHPGDGKFLPAGMQAGSSGPIQRQLAARERH